jgi:hypothetical protein
LPETLTRAQQRTLPARRALAAKFTTPEQKSTHYRALAERSHTGRVTLSAAEAAAVAAALLPEQRRLLGSIASKFPAVDGIDAREADRALA